MFNKKKLNLMYKLLKYFFIVIFLMVLANSFSIYKLKDIYNNFYLTLQNMSRIHSVSLKVDSLCQDVTAYLYDGNTDYIKNYEQKSREIIKIVDELKVTDNVKIYYKCKDIKNMLQSFNQTSIENIKQYQNKVPKIFINDSMYYLIRIKEYIMSECKNLLVLQLMETQNQYVEIGNNITLGENIMYMVILIITGLCILFAIRFSRNISQPIHLLVKRLEMVSKGYFDIEPFEYKGNNEIAILIKSFSLMVVKIKDLIEQIIEKANVENQLKQQEIKNLEMTSLLNKTELDLLQSQINPHFLFNTLNSISALADIEQAYETKKMCEKLSWILRYNLKSSTIVNVKDEYKTISSYLYIQKIRFGSKFTFSLTKDESIDNFKMPSMVLQPFVENAIKHGLEPKKGKGNLNISIIDKEKNIFISIEDDGVGMSESKLEQILNYESDSSNKEGIGVCNVLRRLEIIYGKKVVTMQSLLQKGTKVSMVIPKNVEIV